MTDAHNPTRPAPALAHAQPGADSFACTDSNPFDYGPATLAVRAGQTRTAEGEHSEPIFTTSSFVFPSAEAAKRRFVDDEDGNVYSRFTNPTVATFEQRLAALEGGAFCTATGSGMAAIMTVGLTTLQHGDHVVASSSLFGSAINLFKKTFGRFGIDTTFVSVADPEAWRAATRPETRMLFVETPSNPLCELADISDLADIASSCGALLVVDNCFCTPVLQKPLELGADIVVHSATKYLDGQGRCVGGAIVHNSASLNDELTGFMRSAGPSMSPFNAWVFLKGLETLKIRMKAHCDASLELATWLEHHPAVSRVYHPGLASHPQHALAKRQQSHFGGIVSFEVHGGREAAWSVVDATTLLSITANLGDAKSTITHPATTTHGRLNDGERADAGIGDGLLRISVGLEEIDDIKRDLARGLDVLAAKPSIQNAASA